MCFTTNTTGKEIKSVIKERNNGASWNIPLWPLELPG